MNELIKHFIEVRHDLADEAVVEGESIKGKFLLNADAMPKLRRLAKAGLMDDYVRVDGHSQHVNDFEISEPTEIELELRIDKTKPATGCRYFETFDRLVSGSRKTRQPDYSFYVRDKDFFSESGESNEWYEKYRDTTDLIQLLTDLCHYSENVEGTNYAKRLIFFQSEKLELETVYETEDLRTLNSLERLRSELANSREDSDQRCEVFRTTLVEALAGRPSKTTFAYLMEQFEGIYTKYHRDHQRYLNQFSYERLKTEFESEKAAYVDKLNGIVASLGTKLVAVPAAFLLIAGQFDTENTGSFQNWMLLVGAFILSVVLHLLVGSQRLSLREVGRKIAQLRGSVLKEAESLRPEKEHPERSGSNHIELLHLIPEFLRSEETEESGSISHGLKTLARYWSKQWVRLVLVEICLWLPPILAAAMLIAYN